MQLVTARIVIVISVTVWCMLGLWVGLVALPHSQGLTIVQVWSAMGAHASPFALVLTGWLIAVGGMIIGAAALQRRVDGRLRGWIGVLSAVCLVSGVTGLGLCFTNTWIFGGIALAQGHSDSQYLLAGPQGPYVDACLVLLVFGLVALGVTYLMRSKSSSN